MTYGIIANDLESTLKVILANKNRYCQYLGKCSTNDSRCLYA